MQMAYWRQLDGKATRLYSAAGLLTAQRLNAALKVPIGIIQVCSARVAHWTMALWTFLFLAEQHTAGVKNWGPPSARWAYQAFDRLIGVSHHAQVAWPGSSIQSWIDRSAIAALNQRVMGVPGARLSAASSASKSFAPSMLRPLRGIPFNSVIWWQG
jgi:hypothetical protein